MAASLTLGVEEEFQLVDPRSLELTSGYDRLMRRATDEIKRHFHSEFYQCVVETTTEPPCPTLEVARQQSMQLRATAARLAEKSHLAVVSAGTHPKSRWDRQHRTDDPGGRYKLIEQSLQDVARTLTIYGLHVHVGIDGAQRIAVMNQARNFLPLILAISVNSPFWLEHNTGYQSYRTIVWAPFPLANVPDSFASLDEFEAFRAFLETTESLAVPRRIWWDIRPHHTLPTLEFLIADMPLTHADTMAVVAFIQALVKTLVARLDRGDPLPTLPTTIINENKWRVARDGLRGNLIDYPRKREATTLELLAEALDFVADAAATLGAEEEMAYLRGMLRSDYRTGAERQMDTYKQHKNINDVVRLLMNETFGGIDLDTAMPLAPRKLFSWRSSANRRASPPAPEEEAVEHPEPDPAVRR